MMKKYNLKTGSKNYNKTIESKFNKKMDKIPYTFSLYVKVINPKQDNMKEKNISFIQSNQMTIQIF